MRNRKSQLARYNRKNNPLNALNSCIKAGGARADINVFPKKFYKAEDQEFVSREGNRMVRHYVEGIQKKLVLNYITKYLIKFPRKLFSTEYRLIEKINLNEEVFKKYIITRRKNPTNSSSP